MKENSQHTLNKIWFGLRGNVCFCIIRLPVKVYKELFGCSHCTSPAISKKIVNQILTNDRSINISSPWIIKLYHSHLVKDILKPHIQYDFLAAINSYNSAVSPEHAFQVLQYVKT